MKILIYSSQQNGAGERLQEVIESQVPGDRQEIYRTIGNLAFRLRKPKLDLAIAVLIAANQSELAKLLALQQLFADLRIVLILPDRDNDTVSMGLKLYPRYFSYADGNLQDVAAVLEKMIGRLKR